jgi:hypothetical protein
MNSRNAAVARNLRKTLSVMSFPPGVFVSLNTALDRLKAGGPVTKIRSGRAARLLIRLNPIRSTAKRAMALFPNLVAKSSRFYQHS